MEQTGLTRKMLGVLARMAGLKREGGPSLSVNTLSNWMSLGVNTVVSLLLTPYIIGHLGKDGYGIWVLVLGIVGYYGFLDMGLHSATIRYIARYAGQNDRDSVNKVAGTSLFIFILIGVLVVFVSFAISGPMAGFFHVSPAKSRSFIYMVWLVGISAGLGFPRRLFDAVLMAYEQFVIVNILGVVFMVLRALAMFSVLYSGFGIEAIGMVELGVELLNLVSKIVACRVVSSKVSFLPIKADARTTRELFGFASLTFIALLGDTLRWNVDSLVIGRFLDLKAVGVYGVASIFVKLLLRVSSSVSISTYPRLSALAAGDLDTFRAKYMKYSQATAIVVVGVSLELFILAGDAIMLWVGPDFKGAVPVVLILTVALLFDYTTSIGVNALKAFNRQRLFAAQTVAEGVVNLLLSIILIRHYGIIGVALGTSIPILFTKVLIQPVYTSRIVGVRWVEYFLRTIVGPLCLGVAVALLFYLSGFLAHCGSFVALGVKGAVIGLVYTVSTMVFFHQLYAGLPVYSRFASALGLMPGGSSRSVE